LHYKDSDKLDAVGDGIVDDVGKVLFLAVDELYDSLDKVGPY